MDKQAVIDILTGRMGAGKTSLSHKMAPEYDLVVQTDFSRPMNPQTKKYDDPTREEKESIRAKKRSEILRLHEEGKKVLIEGHPPGVVKLLRDVLPKADRAIVLPTTVAQSFERVAKRAKEDPKEFDFLTEMDSAVSNNKKFDHYLDRIRAAGVPIEELKKTAALSVRHVGKEVLRDYTGMNPHAAKTMGFEDIDDDEILIRRGLSPQEDKETIRHELEEYKAMKGGSKYWPAHEKALKLEKDATFGSEKVLTPLLNRVRFGKAVGKLVEWGSADVPRTPRLLMRHRTPVERAALGQRVGESVTKLVAENPEIIPMQAVPIPGFTPAYLAAKKGLSMAFKKPVQLEKISAEQTPAPKHIKFLDQHFIGTDRDRWRSFRAKLKDPGFVSAVKQDTRSDKKLKQFSEMVGRHDRHDLPALTVHGASGSYKVKYHSDIDRFSCDCGDWTYKQSVKKNKKSDCKHIKMVKAQAERAGEPMRKLAELLQELRLARGIITRKTPGVLGSVYQSQKNEDNADKLKVINSMYTQALPRRHLLKLAVLRGEAARAFLTANEEK